MKDHEVTLVVASLLTLGMLALAVAISWLAWVMGAWVAA